VVSAMALEVVRWIDVLFDIEREINGQSPEKRRALRQERSLPIVEALRVYLERSGMTLPAPTTCTKPSTTC
jgi:transposase